MREIADIVAKAIRQADTRDVMAFTESVQHSISKPGLVAEAMAAFVARELAKGPALGQFLVSVQDDAGEDKGLFVTAASAGDAVQAWEDYFEDDRDAYGPDAMKVFPVPPVAAEPRAHAWGTEVVAADLPKAPSP